MGLQNRKKVSIYIISIFILFFNSPIIIHHVNSPQEFNQRSLNASQINNPTYINCDIVRNQSIAWLNAFILFNISTDDDFVLYYSVYGIGSSAQIIIPDMAHEVNILSGINLIKVPIMISLDTFPGIYEYNLLLMYFNSSSGDPVEQTIYYIETGKIQIVMGFPLLLIVLGVLFTGLYISFIKKINLKKEKQPVGVGTTTTSSSASTVSPVEINEVKTPSASSKPGYFKCPECKKDIKDGSAFCPECGYHIPKFLRNE